MEWAEFQAELAVQEIERNETHCSRHGLMMYSKVLGIWICPDCEFEDD